MHGCIIKPLPAPQGKALSNRYEVKRFTHRCDMHKFLNRGDNALHWKELTVFDLKSGVYTKRIERVRNETVGDMVVTTYTKV